MVSILHKKHCVLGLDRTRMENIEISPLRTGQIPVLGLVRTGQKFLKFACLRTGQKFPNLLPTSVLYNLVG
jgi:hypothetical protein